MTKGQRANKICSGIFQLFRLWDRNHRGVIKVLKPVKQKRKEVLMGMTNQTTSDHIADHKLLKINLTLILTATIILALTLLATLNPKSDSVWCDWTRMGVTVSVLPWISSVGPFIPHFLIWTQYTAVLFDLISLVCGPLWLMWFQMW